MIALFPHTKCPSGYIPISTAVAKLQRSMFGNLPRAQPVTEIQREARWLRLSFGAQKKEASTQIWRAGRAGKLRIYAILPESLEPQVLYPEILACIVRVRGGLPDYVGRLVSFKKLVPASRALYFGIRNSILTVNEPEFELWRTQKYKEGKWPSQQSKKETKKQPGRPRVRDNDLRTQILVCLRDNKWKGGDGIPALKRTLGSIPGATKAPSEDTLARIVRDLYIETGEPGLQIKPRRPRVGTQPKRYRKNRFDFPAN